MRPVRLGLQGFTSYRRPTEVDFSDLDLFAITGPTGAGKSSLVDAITYALFGQVPRMGGRNVKDLISQGQDRLQVSFEFTSNGDRYRIFRSTARKGAPQIQLEQFSISEEDWVAVGDRSDDATKQIERVLGMDYDGFTRSVLLPQGQFHQFVAGKPEERRKVLDEILRLDVYQKMQERANQTARLQEGEAERIAALLQSQFADAMPQNLKETKRRLLDLKKRSVEVGRLKADLAGACALAETVARATQRQREAAAAVEAAEKSLAQAVALLASGEEAVRGLEERLKQTEEALAANAYDADLFQRLSHGLGAAQELERAEKRLADLERDSKAKEAALKEAGQQAGGTRKQAEAAASAFEQAQAALEELRRQHAADQLRQGLRPGDACPVCGQAVATLPEIEHPPLQEAERALAQTRAAGDAARRASQEAEKALALAGQAVETGRSRLSQAQDDSSRHRQALLDALAGREASLEDIRAALQLQRDARTQRESLEGEREATRSKREAQSAALAEAKANAARYGAEREATARDLEAAEKEAQGGRVSLRAAADTGGWSDVVAALEHGQDAGALLRQRLQTVERENDAVQQGLGATEKEISRLESAIEKAKDLREQERESRGEGKLAREVANLLRANAFPGFVREKALRILAEDGSRHLHELSGGRYDFSVDEQEFLITDHWNGDEERSVKTLSGGETFLASLALAVALAERLPALAPGGGSRSLESLFVDEGFSNLDTETMDVVASALEVLGASGNRMVGVITHVPALAERMPARITVVKSESGSLIEKD
ncbi:MAG: SMC family ATPase [Chloroflexi bacterium]|nr:SMC family ATPase [Chloroflexota bacterium]